MSWHENRAIARTKPVTRHCEKCGRNIDAALVWHVCQRAGGAVREQRVRIAPRRASLPSRRLRRRFETRVGHIEGGSRWCYAQGCGHDDCYRKESEYSAARKLAGKR